MKKDYRERGKWLPEDDPLECNLKGHVNDYAYEVLKGKLPEQLIMILKGSNIYKFDDSYAIGYLSNLVAGYIQITEDRIKELEDKIAKLENRTNISN